MRIKKKELLKSIEDCFGYSLDLKSSEIKNESHWLDKLESVVIDRRGDINSNTTQSKSFNEIDMSELNENHQFYTNKITEMFAKEAKRDKRLSI